MTKTSLLTSGQNPKIKAVIKLRTKRQRDQLGLFLIEGYRELSFAAKANVAIVELFYSPGHFLKTNEQALIDQVRTQGARVFEVSQEIFDKLSYRDRGDGLIAVAKQQRQGLCALETIASKVSSPCFVVAEAIEKPGNLGSILRSCDAGQITALIVCDPKTDIYNPNVVRASTGTLFTVPVIELDQKTALNFFAKTKTRVVATSPRAKTVFTKADLTGSLAIAVGTEQLGLSSAWLDRADLRVKIPMLGQCDSLNVAAATTLLVYEALRQKSELD